MREVKPIYFEGLILRLAELKDYPQWVALREKSKAFLQPWEPPWYEEDMTRAAFRRRLKLQDEDLEKDQCYPFLIFREADGVLLGGATLGFVRRGVTQSATLGYWMGEPYAGKGIMTKAVRALIPFAFQTLKLHRIEAACLPHNEPSVRVLKKAGFEREGYARSYLFINGAWSDHILFGLVDPGSLANG